MYITGVVLAAAGFLCGFIIFPEEAMTDGVYSSVVCDTSLCLSLRLYLRGLWQMTFFTELPFLGVGIQYIHFAKEEPQLYRLLFLTANEEEYSSVMDALRHSQELVRDSLRQIYHIDGHTADRYFHDMWLVVHSLATLAVTGGCPYSEEEMENILTGFSISLFKAIKEIPGFTDDNYDRDTIFRELVEKK